MPFPLKVHDSVLGMVKLHPSQAIPTDLLSSFPTFISRTEQELSIVAPLHLLPVSRAFRLIQIEGIFGDLEYGILKELIDPLAEAQIWILALCTHDTDYVLIHESDLPQAVKALANAGHTVI
jgi:hypothetical protein